MNIFESTGRIPPGLVSISFFNPEKLQRSILKKISELQQLEELESEKIGANKLFNPKKPEFIKELDRITNKAKEEGIKIGVDIGFNLAQKKNIN